MSDDRFRDDVTRLPRGTAYWVQIARQQLAEARADLCPCGTPRTHCADHREDESK